MSGTNTIHSFVGALFLNKAACLLVLVMGWLYGVSPSFAQTVIDFDASIAPTATFSPTMQGSDNALLMTWTPAQLQNASGPVMDFGLQFADPVNLTWQRVRIVMGETTYSHRNMVREFMHNFDLPGSPPVVVYDGPLTVSTTGSNQYWRVPTQGRFFYSGQSRLAGTPGPRAPG